MKSSFLLLFVPFLSAALALPLPPPSSDSVNGASTLVVRTSAGINALYHNEKRGGSAQPSTNPSAESNVEPREAPNELDEEMPFHKEDSGHSNTVDNSDKESIAGSDVGSQSGSHASTISLISFKNSVLTMTKAAKKGVTLQIKWAKIYNKAIPKFMDDAKNKGFTLTRTPFLPQEQNSHRDQATTQPISAEKAMDLVKFFKSRFTSAPNILLF